MTFVADEYREKKSEDDGNRRYPEWARFDGDLDQLGQDDDDGNGRDGKGVPCLYGRHGL